MEKPKLIIVFDTDLRPESARCSCGQEMPHIGSRVTHSAEIRAFYKKVFKAHVKQMHSCEDVNQAAARIVREAPEKM